MKTLTENQSTYTTTEITVKGQTYAVTVVKGKFNYVNILKKSNNPFGTSGKDFKDFNEAVMNYKSAEMKVELLKIELGLN